MTSQDNRRRSFLIGLLAGIALRPDRRHLPVGVRRPRQPRPSEGAEARRCALTAPASVPFPGADIRARNLTMAYLIAASTAPSHGHELNQRRIEPRQPRVREFRSLFRIHLELHRGQPQPGQSHQCAAHSEIHRGRPDGRRDTRDGIQHRIRFLARPHAGTALLHGELQEPRFDRSATPIPEPPRHHVR